MKELYKKILGIKENINDEYYLENLCDLYQDCASEIEELKTKHEETYKILNEIIISPLRDGNKKAILELIKKFELEFQRNLLNNK